MAQLCLAVKARSGRGQGLGPGAWGRGKGRDRVHDEACSPPPPASRFSGGETEDPRMRQRSSAGTRSRSSAAVVAPGQLWSEVLWCPTRAHKPSVGPEPRTVRRDIRAGDGSRFWKLHSSDFGINPRFCLPEESLLTTAPAASVPVLPEGNPPPPPPPAPAPATGPCFLTDFCDIQTCNHHLLLMRVTRGAGVCSQQHQFRFPLSVFPLMSFMHGHTEPPRSKSQLFPASIFMNISITGNLMLLHVNNLQLGANGCSLLQPGGVRRFPSGVRGSAAEPPLLLLPPPTPLPCCCGGLLVILQTCFLSRGHDKVTATRRALNEKLMILLSNTAEEEESEEEDEEEAVGRDTKKNGHGPEAQ